MDSAKNGRWIILLKKFGRFRVKTSDIINLKNILLISSIMAHESVSLCSCIYMYSVFEFKILKLRLKKKILFWTNFKIPHLYSSTF